MSARVTVTKLSKSRWEVKCHERGCGYRIVVSAWHTAGTRRYMHQLSHRG